VIMSENGECASGVRAIVGEMSQVDRRLYHALTAHDSRFDGVFFVGVTSTGIYCRPVCRVKTPKAANCRFYDTAQEAEQAGFRPCLRCRPELAPGNAPVDDAQRIAQLIVQRLAEGQLDEEPGLEAIASQFELSSRQIRRIVQHELGVPPIQLLLTRRLLLAKQLLTETTWPMTDVAFASGFASLRRFNDAFTRRYGMAPTRLRKKASDGVAMVAGETAVLQLSYRPPYDWEGLLRFLAARALTGVEHVTDRSYARTVQLGRAMARRSQPGGVDQAAGGAARNRSVDGELHRDARNALAGCVSQGGHRRAQQPGRRVGHRSGNALASVAAVA